MNAWQKTVAKYTRLHKGKSLTEILPLAKAEYRKTHKVGKIAKKHKTRHHKKRSHKKRGRKQRGGGAMESGAMESGAMESRAMESGAMESGAIEGENIPLPANYYECDNNLFGGKKSKKRHHKKKRHTKKKRGRKQRGGQDEYSERRGPGDPYP